MARVPDDMSETHGMKDICRARIENRAYPVLRGPGPVATTVLAVAIVSLGFAIWPTAAAFLGLAGVTFLVSAGTALRLRTEAQRSDFVIIAVMASLCFAWAYMVYFGFRGFGAPLHLLILWCGALVTGFARFLRFYRYAWSTATAAASACDADTLANYAEYLLEHRPGPASPQLAREFYRLASEEVLYYPEPAPRHTGIIKRYIDLLRTGVGGHADIHEAMWWQERLREVEVGVPCPTLAGLGAEDSNPVSRIPELQSGDGKLGIRNGRPTWRIAVDNPAAASADPASISFQPFLLPEGAVLACILCLHNESSGTTVRYRAFDVSDPVAETYVMALEHRLSWRVELSGDSVSPSGRRKAGRKKVIRTLSLSGSGLMEGLEAALSYNRHLKREPDGHAALARFTAAIENEAQKSDLLSAWSTTETNGLRESED